MCALSCMVSLSGAGGHGEDSVSRTQKRQSCSAALLSGRTLSSYKGRNYYDRMVRQRYVFSAGQHTARSGRNAGQQDTRERDGLLILSRPSYDQAVRYNTHRTFPDARQRKATNGASSTIACHLSLSYSSSVTGSSHSFEVSSPGISKARCANQLSEAAPCQCFTPAGIWMIVPGSISTAGLPSS